MTNSDIPQQNSAFRLLRVISIDSYSPGGEIILRVEGGAILTGENGAGKTSLIRLIPVFFGELPRRISVGTQSFADFYLARTTSYIIFEYERRGVVCQAVVYAGHGDEAYVYRFIRAPYQLGFFTEADGKTIVPGDSLPTHLKKLRVDCSRALTHDNYRAIIQGRSHAGRDASAHRAYVADYAFTTPGNRLDHIDRIVSGMFRRQAEFKDFLRMVVSYISDRDDAIAVTGDRSKIAVWPKQYAAYQSVMRLAPRMEDVNRLDADISACGDLLCGLHAKMLVLMNHVGKQAEQSMHLHNEAQQDLERQSEKHKAEVEDISQKEASARFEAKQHEDRIGALDVRNAEYVKAEIKQKARLVSELPSTDSKIKEARDRRETVVGKQGKIDQKYEAFKLAKTKELNDRTEAALQEKEATRELYDLRLSELDTRRDALREEAGREHRRHIEVAEELANRLRDDSIRHEQATKHPTPDPLLTEAWQRKQEVADRARGAMKAPKERLGRAIEAQKAAQIAFGRQDEVVRSLERRIDELGTQISRLHAQADPAPGSFLSFLRKERPGLAARHSQGHRRKAAIPYRSGSRDGRKRRFCALWCVARPIAHRLPAGSRRIAVARGNQGN